MVHLLKAMLAFLILFICISFGNYKYSVNTYDLFSLFGDATAATFENKLIINTPQFQVLPSKRSQHELACQLLEIAVASFDIRYAKQFHRLVESSKNQDRRVYAYELMRSYFLVKAFRTDFNTYSWEEKQNLLFIKNIVRITKQDIENYGLLVKNDDLYSDLLKLRPQTPLYLEYRNNMLIFLTSKSKNITPFKVETVSKKSKGDTVDNLRKALIDKGFIDEKSPFTGVYDAELEAGIKNFQKEYNLKVDGIMGELSYKLLFLTNHEKAIMLARAILRLNDTNLRKQTSYILVNIPEMRMHVYKDGYTVLDSRVVVGRKDRQTPRINSDISSVVLNPTWTAPETIMAKDYLPKLRKDRLYLSKKGIQILDWNNNVIDPEQLTLKDLTEKGFKPYRMVQQPGTDNALGLYKFNFPNKHDVYLHSTSAPSAFNKDYRALSSGCIRVEESKKLAELLLEKTVYTPKVIKFYIEKHETKWATLKFRMPVYLAYWTAYIGQDRKVYFKPDIYGIDEGVRELPVEITQHF